MFKKLLILAIMVALIAQVLTFTHAEGFFQDGSASHPWLIYTPTDLAAMAGATARSSHHFLMMNDLDLSGYANWSPIGNRYDNHILFDFTGRFDGGGHKITGLKTNLGGLFKRLGIGGEICNLTVDGNVTGGGIIVATVIGGTIRNVTTYGSSKTVWEQGLLSQGETKAGGVAGMTNEFPQTFNYRCETAKFINCVNYAYVESNMCAGGILGASAKASWAYMTSPDMAVAYFEGCRNYGTLYGGRGTGGIAGIVGYQSVDTWAEKPSPVPQVIFKECYSEAEVHVLGDVGSFYGGIVGGYPGYQGIRLERCATNNTAFFEHRWPTIGNVFNGGLIGHYGPGNVDIVDCYVGGTLNYAEGAYCGGINGKTMANSRTQNVFINSNMWVDYTTNFANANGFAKNMVGVLSGELVDNSASFTNVYYNANKMSGFNTNQYVGYFRNSPTFTNIVKLDDDESKIQNNFETFDFDTVWAIEPGINQGYPYLKWAREYFPGGSKEAPPKPPKPDPGPAPTFGGGSGTEEAPYIIKTPKHLDDIRYFVGVEHTDKYFLMDRDIDLTDYITEKWPTAGWE
ncbi:MAG: hypothetical protein FWD16_03210, partial [Clostridia bacterium]|nr:hypothetical protein [Clostridia bacterium]